MKRLPYFLLALCILASFFFGANIAGLQNTAAQIVSALDPVGYDVTYFDPAAGESVTAEGVSVRFGETESKLSNGAVVATAYARFVCLDEVLLARNTARTGTLAMGLGAVVLLLLAAMTAMSLRLCAAALRRDLRARRRALARRAARANVTRLMPASAPQRRAA